MSYVDSLKSKIDDATNYTAEFKAAFSAKIDTMDTNDPTVFLKALGDYINGLTLGSEGDKALHRSWGLVQFLWGLSSFYDKLITNQSYTTGEKAELITALVEQKGVPGGDGKWLF